MEIPLPMAGIDSSNEAEHKKLEGKWHGFL